MQAVVIGLIIASLFAPIDVNPTDGRQVLALASLSGQVSGSSCMQPGIATMGCLIAGVLECGLPPTSCHMSVL